MIEHFRQALCIDQTCSITMTPALQVMISAVLATKVSLGRAACADAIHPSDIHNMLCIHYCSRPGSKQCASQTSQALACLAQCAGLRAAMCFRLLACTCIQGVQRQQLHKGSSLCIDSCRLQACTTQCGTEMPCFIKEHCTHYK